MILLLNFIKNYWIVANDNSVRTSYRRGTLVVFQVFVLGKQVYDLYVKLYT